LDAVRDGALVRVTKQGKHIATMVPPGYERDTTIVVHPDGTVDGPMPLTWRLLRD
jgi:antitoxin (DNA-binding transcriptional repressor) of toxin-antitoxin stability system